MTDSHVSFVPQGVGHKVSHLAETVQDGIGAGLRVRRCQGEGAWLRAEYQRIQTFLREPLQRRGVERSAFHLAENKSTCTILAQSRLREEWLVRSACHLADIVQRGLESTCAKIWRILAGAWLREEWGAVRFTPP